MNIVETLVLVAHVLVAVAICGFVLLQHGKGADMGAAPWRATLNAYNRRLGAYNAEIEAGRQRGASNGSRLQAADGRRRTN